jgi:hypothetical protein
MAKFNHESILEKYKELQPANGTKYTPRLGYYLIQEVSEHAIFIDFFIAKALWKEHQTDHFRDDVIVQIGTANLQEGSVNPNTFDHYSLVDKVIHVISLLDDKIMFKGEETPFVKCNWQFDKSEITILKSKPSFFDMLEKDPSILNDVLRDTDDGGNDGTDLYDDEAYDNL